MDFFERQDRSRANTKWLLAYFVTGVLALITVIYLALLLAFGAGKGGHRHYGYSAQSASGLWNPQLFLGSALGTLAVVLIGSLYKTAELSAGGSKVAEMLGGVPINANTTDPQERRLLNVVEEMAIASGVPVPRVYILPKEGGINAFAAGFSTSDAVIGVTRGSVQILGRDELQGVIAHEFSHILNGDMRLNIRLMGYVFGILCLTIIGRILLRTRGRKNPLPLVGLILVITGWVGVFFGKLIQAAVSRQREYLADASAVQFTRNPEGLAAALKKIGGLAAGSRLAAPQAAEASHLFFGNGLRAPLFGLMSTHPPLTDRIRALDPAFDGRFPPVLLPAGFRETPEVYRDESMLSDLSDASFGEIILPSGQTAESFSGFRSQAGTENALRGDDFVSSPGFIQNIGSPNVGHLRYAEQLRASMPEELQNAARETTGAVAVVFGTLLSDDPVVQEKQLEEIILNGSEFLKSETLKLLPLVKSVKARVRLPLVDMVLPALRQLSPNQFQTFRAAVENLSGMDGEIDLLEYMIQKSIMRHLEPYYVGAKKPVVQYYSLRGLGEDCAVLLSGLAHIGAAAEEEAITAFQRGAEPLGYAGRTRLQLFPPERCGLDMVDKALERLSQAAPQIKKNVINACVLTIAADGILTENEGELLRAISDSLDCPMPPLVSQA